MKEGKANTVKLYNTVLNSLSHELRTPIATIIGATDNLQHNDARLTQQHKQELFAEISKASFRLNQQVENLLNMSRLESGFIQPKEDWCDISELIYSIITRIEENKPKQTIIVNVRENIPLIKSDKGILEEILYNLVNNSVQYTPDASVIHIKATAALSYITFEVSDNGPGFPVQETENVFSKFYRLNNPVTGGTGLGLSIVKGFTEALGGTVVLQNAEAGGAVFTIRIPVETTHLNTSVHE